nr:hypothetical protein [Tanacetum cinerariifolium]
MPRECLKIIESKSKVRQTRAKAVVAKVGTSSSTPSISADIAELKDMVKALLLDKKNQSSAPTPSTTPAPVKAVELSCVTCGGAHSHQNYPATQENAYRDNSQNYVSQAAAVNYNQRNTGFRPHLVANQIRPPSFPPHQNNQNNFNRGNNFNQNRGGNFNQSNFNPPSFNQGQLNRPQPRSKYAEPVPEHPKSVPESAKSNGHSDGNDVQTCVMGVHMSGCEEDGDLGEKGVMGVHMSGCEEDGDLGEKGSYLVVRAGDGFGDWAS